MMLRSTVKVEQLGMKMREGRLRWYGHVMRRDQKYVRRKMIKIELLEKRETKEKIFKSSKEDTQEVGAKEMDVKDRTVWRQICCGYP